METVAFLEYLHEHASADDLARNLAEILVLRRHDELVPAVLHAPAVERIAG